MNRARPPRCAPPRCPLAPRLPPAPRAGNLCVFASSASADVVLLGGGLVAAYVACELQSRGKRVLVISQPRGAEPPLCPLFSLHECESLSELSSAAAGGWTAGELHSCGALRLGAASELAALDAVSPLASLQRLDASELRSRHRFLQLPSGCEGRLDGGGGVLSAEAAGQRLRARAQRLGVRWLDASVLELQDSGGSFRLALEGPAGRSEAECEQLLLAPAGAAEAAVALRLLATAAADGRLLRLPSAAAAEGACRPRALQEQYARAPLLSLARGALHPPRGEAEEAEEAAADGARRAPALLLPAEGGALLLRLAGAGGVAPEPAAAARAAARLARSLAQLPPPPRWARGWLELAAEDGLPVVDTLAGFEEGRAALLCADSVLAPALGPLARELLGRGAPSQTRLRLSASRAAVEQPAAAQAAAAAAEEAAAAAAAERGEGAPREETAARGTFEGGRQRERGRDSDEFQVMPRAARGGTGF